MKTPVGHLKSLFRQGGQVGGHRGAAAPPPATPSAAHAGHEDDPAWQRSPICQ